MTGKYCETYKFDQAIFVIFVAVRYQIAAKKITVIIKINTFQNTRLAQVHAEVKQYFLQKILLSDKKQAMKQLYEN